MDRVIEKDEIGTIASLIIQVLTIPIPETFQPDALVTIPGMGETWRVLQPLKEWEKSTAEHFLLAGMYWGEQQFEELSMELLKQSPYNLKRTENVHTQLSARHTKAQTDWIIRRASKLEITSFIFYAPTYHITRAYLTLLKSLIQSEIKPVIMIPKPIVMSPNVIIPEANAQARSLIPGEIERIKIYQEKGDVATLDELENYLDFTLYPFLSLNLG